jgi:hypothetical protein
MTPSFFLLLSLMAMSNLVNVECELGGPHILGKTFIMSSNNKRKTWDFHQPKFGNFLLQIQ